MTVGVSFTSCLFCYSLKPLIPDSFLKNPLLIVDLEDPDLGVFNICIEKAYR